MTQISLLYFQVNSQNSLVSGRLILISIWVFPKIWETPQIIHFNRGFHYFHHPFLGFFSLVLVQHPLCFPRRSASNNPHPPFPSPEMMTTKNASVPGRWIARMHQLGRPFPKHVCTSRGWAFGFGRQILRFWRFGDRQPNIP